MKSVFEWHKKKYHTEIERVEKQIYIGNMDIGKNEMSLRIDVNDLVCLPFDSV